MSICVNTQRYLAANENIYFTKPTQRHKGIKEYKQVQVESETKVRRIAAGALLANIVANIVANRCGGGTRNK